MGDRGGRPDAVASAGSVKSVSPGGCTLSSAAHVDLLIRAIHAALLVPLMFRSSADDPREGVSVPTTAARRVFSGMCLGGAVRGLLPS